MYYRHLRITNYVSFDPFILAINLDSVSSSNVFSTSVSLLRCNVLLFQINEFSLVFKKKKNPSPNLGACTNITLN